MTLEECKEWVAKDYDTTWDILMELNPKNIQDEFLLVAIELYYANGVREGFKKAITVFEKVYCNNESQDELYREIEKDLNSALEHI